ncbi:FCD domain-containing protein [Mycolicibacterium sp. 050232]|uniref:FadR/GntR family transcriptional regulator n=1 Tax=Mycolicibacterium sp. 050232 TaxID=3113982 RepID=UPI002E2D919C|nr:FCD domain-containing protein [Mycolicibacterium sp. 050232]MED5811098.1 FCD domain-containing protein [Mycolicibacterium sp. 050232]
MGASLSDECAEAKLVEALGVSRPSVRAAVRSLVQAGLLESRQGDGTYVVADDETTVALLRVIGAADQIEAQLVRHSLEVLAAREAAVHRSAADIEALRVAVAGRRDAKVKADLKAFIEHDVAFHVTVARASHNALLCEFIASFEAVMRDAEHAARCMRVPDHPHREFHHDLYEAIQRGDQEAATRAAVHGLDVRERHLNAVGS